MIQCVLCTLTNNLDNITQSAKLKHAVDHTLTLVYKHNKCSCITKREKLLEKFVLEFISTSS